MHVIEPNAGQYRAAALALVLVAALTGAMIAIQWVNSITGPLLLPVAVAYFLFNGGYVFAVVKDQLQTRGAKIGLAAVMLNFAAMLLSDFPTIWTALSICAVVTALSAHCCYLEKPNAQRPNYSNSTIT